MIDYFTSFFKLPLLNPYLDRGAHFTHGVNFAVGGSTALNASYLGANRIESSLSNSSLSVQLGWFKSHLQTICPHTSECKEKLKRTLFLVGEIGGNDYNYALFQGKTVQELIKMVPRVVQAITTAVQEVIHYGAVRVIIPGNFPMGCSPLYLSQIKTNDSTMYDDLHRIKALNDFAKFHNILLQQGIQELQQQHPNVSIVYADYCSALTGILQNASSLGFDKKVVQKACCGIGDNDYNVNTTQMCGMPNVPVCSKPKKYVSWDGIHMTQHAYRLMAKWLLKGIVKSMFNKA